MVCFDSRIINPKYIIDIKFYKSKLLNDIDCLSNADIELIEEEVLYNEKFEYRQFTYWLQNERIYRKPQINIYLKDELITKQFDSDEEALQYLSITFKDWIWL